MATSTKSTMRAIGVAEYGPIENLRSKEVPRPPSPTGEQILVRVKGVSVNPADAKIRSGTYDRAPDYYDRVKPLLHADPNFHILGLDGAGVVEEIGPDVRCFKKGDEVFYLGNPAAQGSYAELHLADQRRAGHKPHSLDFVQAAALPLTYGTAYEALYERLGILKGEKAGILIIDGASGVGSMASQIARRLLRLPVVITTASKPEAQEFSRDIGAAHYVINEQGSFAEQIQKLNLNPHIPLKYALITSHAEQYIGRIAEVMAPFGKACSAVQIKLDTHATQIMNKSLTFSWCWLGTGPYHHYFNDDARKHHQWFEELATLIDSGRIRCHLTKREKLSLEGIRAAHRVIEAGPTIGKIGLGVDERGDGEPFC